ncbi:MAG: hypothetical protein IPJ31_12775 [Bacteroidetes bacterium]|nr:hypothetical protein [Bacteroidota bacterium]
MTGSIIADFTMDIHLGCDDDTVFYQYQCAWLEANPTYQWFWRCKWIIFTNPTHIYLNQDTFTVMLIANDNNCIDTITKFIDLRHPLTAAFGLNPGDSLCVTQSISAISNSDPAGFAHSWHYGEGTVTNTGVNPLFPPPFYYPPPELYNLLWL